MFVIIWFQRFWDENNDVCVKKKRSTEKLIFLLQTLSGSKNLGLLMDL